MLGRLSLISWDIKTWKKKKNPKISGGEKENFAVINAYMTCGSGTDGCGQGADLHFVVICWTFEEEYNGFYQKKKVIQSYNIQGSS